MAETKTVSRSMYLQALGLFTLGHSYSERSDEIRKELALLLGTDPDSHLSDEMYSSGKADFDEAFKREGLAVEEEK